jgi:hypothetical protein
MKHKWRKNEVAIHLPIPTMVTLKFSWKSFPIRLQTVNDLYSNEPILDECFNVNYFYVKSYDSWVQNILEEYKLDSTNTS